MSAWTFFNRDLSWLSFNERVLMEAGSKDVPLMERFKFLSIFSSNLDEFYRVRIPALLAVEKIMNDATAGVYLSVQETINRQQKLFGKTLNEALIPLLSKEGYDLLMDHPFPAGISTAINNYFFNELAGLIQPVQIHDKSEFFPENNRLYLAVITEQKKEEYCYLVNIPSDTLPRFFKTDDKDRNYILFLEDIIADHLRFIVPGNIKGAYNIKITRDAELNLQDEYSEDLAEKIEKQLAKRDFGFATRFLYQPEIPLRHLEHLIDIFKLHKASLVEGGHHHNLKDLGSLPVKAERLLNPALPAINRTSFVDHQETLFEKLTSKDIIVHAPYESYEIVLRFFNEAAINADVQEIYTTLYRVATDSRIAKALISAAKNGKKVTVLVELKARFDEANNIHWAKKMKEAGVKIIYSENRLKVHAKVALIKRKNATTSLLGLFATGNLNESTARFYTDHILMTSNQKLAAELDTLFNWLGKKRAELEKENVPFQHLLVAQFNLLNEFINLIDEQIKLAKEGKPASIIIKLNNLEEKTLISKLYEASNAGVKIQLIVRSICCLIPGVAGQSENITVTRIVDRFLEHGRVFIFGTGENEKIFLGSADWMNRNIHRRIEVCFPLWDQNIKNEIKDLIELQLADNMKAINLDGNLENIPVSNGAKSVRSQEAIYNYLNA